MQQMKEQGKNPPDQTNKEKIGKLPEKRIQSNDCKDDPKFGNRMKKIQETFHKDLLTRTKEQTNNDEQHNK